MIQKVGGLHVWSRILYLWTQQE